jgi:hypothetical protein
MPTAKADPAWPFAATAASHIRAWPNPGDASGEADEHAAAAADAAAEPTAAASDDANPAGAEPSTQAFYKHLNESYDDLADSVLRCKIYGSAL